MRYVQLRLDAHEDPRLRRAGGCAFNVLNALARMVARESGADGHLAPRWCDIETIARWACETSELDVRDSLAKLQLEGAISGSLAEGLTIAPDLWCDYVNERLRKRLIRDKAVRADVEPAAAPVTCAECDDGMIKNSEGRYVKCCSCPRGRELARAVWATRQGERDSEARRSAEPERTGTGLPSGIQQELDGIIGRRKAGGE